MKSLDQVDSLQRRDPGMYCYITSYSADSTLSMDNEHVKMQSGVGAYGYA